MGYPSGTAERRAYENACYHRNKLRPEYMERRRALNCASTGKRSAREFGNTVEAIPAKAIMALRLAPCTYCGTPGPGTIDHMVPLAPPHNGPHTLANLTSACHRCNTQKGNTTADEFRQLLKERTK